MKDALPRVPHGPITPGHPEPVKKKDITALTKPKPLDTGVILHVEFKATQLHFPQ